MLFLADVVSLIALLLVMFLPFWIAQSRHHKNKKVIFWICLLLGWTVIVWLPLVVYSLISNPIEKKFDVL